MLIVDVNKLNGNLKVWISMDYVVELSLETADLKRQREVESTSAKESRLEPFHAAEDHRSLCSITSSLRPIETRLQHAKTCKQGVCTLCLFTRVSTFHQAKS